jgi:hypothetical protein
MYRIQRLLTNKLSKQNKKEWINNKLLEVEKAYRRNDASKFYKDIKYCNRQLTIFILYDRYLKSVMIIILIYTICLLTFHKHLMQ